VEAVALASTSTDYGKYAKEQKETADQLRRGAIALFVVAAIITGVWVIWIGAEEIELGAILLRLGLSLSFFGAATYAITESRRHRKEEVKAKDTQLKLVALEPFIANVNPARREQFKLAIAHHVFISDNGYLPAPPEEQVKEEPE